jgi:hypothetical protein
MMIWTHIGRSCLCLLQTKTISKISRTSTKKNKFFQTSMKKNKASSVVIGGHPAGLMLSVIRSVE